MKHTTKLSAGAQIAIVAIAAAVVIIIWFACIFDSLLDLVIALWTVFFLLVLGVCITAVIAVLLYDYMIQK